MSKPMKPKTTGLSAGPTAYWDARSDAVKAAEIKRLRDLLKLVVDDMVIGEDFEHLLMLIEKEVGDE